MAAFLSKNRIFYSEAELDAVIRDLGEEHEPRVELVDFGSLRQNFPTDEPTFGPHERREQISARQRAIQHRYGLGRR